MRQRTLSFVNASYVCGLFDVEVRQFANAAKLSSFVTVLPVMVIVAKEPPWRLIGSVKTLKKQCGLRRIIAGLHWVPRLSPDMIVNKLAYGCGTRVSQDELRPMMDVGI